MVRMSNELLQDSKTYIINLVTSEVLRALAVEIDRVVMNGSGVDPEPAGILQAAGIGSVDAASAPVTQDMLDDAVQTLAKANFSAGAAILSPANARALTTEKDQLQAPGRRTRKT